MHTYTYPLDLLETDLKIAQSVTFIPITSIERRIVKNTTTDKDGTAKAVIILPTPSNITDSNSQTWSSASVSTQLSTLAKGIAKAGNAAGDALGSTKIKAASDILAKGVSMLNGANATYGALSLYAGFRKRMFNPSYYQNYEGSGLRAFMFSYDFQPRSREEALEVIRIIMAFKKYSCPKLGLASDGNEDAFKGIEDTLDSVGDFTASTVGNFIGGALDFLNIGNFFTNKPDPGSPKNGSWFMQQPCYWKIVFGNKYLNDMMHLSHMVLKDVTCSYGQDVETFRDGIPKQFSLTLSFSAVDMLDEDQFNLEKGYTDDSGVDESNVEGITQMIADIANIRNNIYSSQLKAKEMAQIQKSRLKNIISSKLPGSGGNGRNYIN